MNQFSCLFESGMGHHHKHIGACAALTAIVILGLLVTSYVTYWYRVKFDFSIFTGLSSLIHSFDKPSL